MYSLSNKRCSAPCVNYIEQADYKNLLKMRFNCIRKIKNPTELGIRDKMAAAKELLDRTGLVKTEKMQVEAKGGVMLMPAKQAQDDDD